MPTRLLAFGDSLCAGYSRGHGFTPWAPLLAKILSIGEIDYVGLNGFKTQQLVANANAEKIHDPFTSTRCLGLRRKLQSKPPYAWVFILCGVNDLADRVPAGEIVRNIALLHTFVHNAGARSVAMTIPDSRGAHQFNWLRRARSETNTAIEAWARSQPATRTRFVDAAAIVPWNNETVQKGLWDDDGLHFSASGYDAFSRGLAPLVAHFLGANPQAVGRLVGAQHSTYAEPNSTDTTMKVPRIWVRSLNQTSTFAANAAVYAQFDDGRVRMRLAPAALVIASFERFWAIARLLDKLGTFQKAQRIQPAPLPAFGSCPRPYLTPEGLGVSASHALAWSMSLQRNQTTAIFEDNIAVSDIRNAQLRLLAFAQKLPSDASTNQRGEVRYLGGGSSRFTHAYTISPGAAAELLRMYRTKAGCSLVTELHTHYCKEPAFTRYKRCTFAKGNPGGLLYGTGIIGQRRNMAGLQRVAIGMDRNVVKMAARPIVIAFPGRFERAARVLDSLGVFPHARQLHPKTAPNVTGCDVNNSSTISKLLLPHERGLLSLSATHAAAWEVVVASNKTTAVFEDDIAVDRPALAQARLQEFFRDAPCDLVLLGHCGNRASRCTHAYVISPSAAATLLRVYRRFLSRGCIMPPDDPQDLYYCNNRASTCCSKASGVPGDGLFGGGIVGQNRSLPHYLHFRPCWMLKAPQRLKAGCNDVFDREKPAGDGTMLATSGILSLAS